MIEPISRASQATVPRPLPKNRSLPVSSSARTPPAPKSSSRSRSPSEARVNSLRSAKRATAQAIAARKTMVSATIKVSNALPPAGAKATTAASAAMIATLRSALTPTKLADHDQDPGPYRGQAEADREHRHRAGAHRRSSPVIPSVIGALCHPDDRHREDHRQPDRDHRGVGDRLE